MDQFEQNLVSLLFKHYSKRFLTSTSPPSDWVTIKNEFMLEVEIIVEQKFEETQDVILCNSPPDNVVVIP